jgi:hypothetical protein
VRRAHTAIVQNRTKGTGSAGQAEYVNAGAPITVRGNRHPLTQEEIRLWGDSAKVTEKFFCNSWPGDMFSEITIDGEPWDQVAPVERHGLGQATRHDEVVLRKR